MLSLIIRTIIDNKVVYLSFIESKQIILFKIHKIALLFFIGSLTGLNAQVGVTTVGIQLKPIIPINYFGGGPIQLSNEFATFDLTSKLGYSFGMVVRHGFTKMISIESESIILEEITIFLALLVMSMQAIKQTLDLLATNYPSKVLFTLG